MLGCWELKFVFGIYCWFSPETDGVKYGFLFKFLIFISSLTDKMFPDDRFDIVQIKKLS